MVRRLVLTIACLALCYGLSECVRFQPSCPIDIDECYFEPCQNGATCVDGIMTHTCDCAPGYEGENCENEINECDGVTCQNGGTCEDGINSYTCSCMLGYDGMNCENDIDECIGVECQNGGTCQDGVNSFSCDCMLGYEGTYCESDVDFCLGTPCQNGGTCTDGLTTYTCKCPEGYAGTDCQTDLCGLTYDGKCYWIINELSTYDQSVSRCAAQGGGTPANIYSAQHLDDVLTYMRTITGEFYYIFIGMQFNPATQTLTNFDFSTPSYTSGWRSFDPVIDVNYIYTAIDASQDPSDTGNGMLTVRFNWAKLGVLCEESVPVE